MPDPTDAGNLADLDADYDKKKAIYNTLVQDALHNNDPSRIDAILAAKQAMTESLSKMLALSAKSGTDAQQHELIRRIMEIQRDYNGLLVATDKLQTLRMINQTVEARQGTGLKIYGTLFIVGALMLLVVVARTR